MTKEEAKNFLIDISYKFGNMNIEEYVTERDGEKMREAVEVLDQKPCENYIARPATEERKESSEQSNELSKAFALGLAFGFGEKHNQMDKVIDEVKKAITPQQKIGPWTPVNEGLPNLDDFSGPKVWQKEVLITGYLRYDDTKELFVSEAFAEDVILNRVFDTVVVAWMPLPKPYKTESEE